MINIYLCLLTLSLPFPISGIQKCSDTPSSPHSYPVDQKLYENNFCFNFNFFSLLIPPFARILNVILFAEIALKEILASVPTLTY